MIRGLSLPGLAAWLALWAAGSHADEGGLDPDGEGLQVLNARGRPPARARPPTRVPEGSGLLWQWSKYYTTKMCEIYMETTDGGNCKSTVTCKHGGTLDCPYWPKFNGEANCTLGGRTTCVDPRIGEFTIIYTQIDGTDGEGLTDPMILLKSMEPQEPIDVSALALEKHNADMSDDVRTRDPGPFVCQRLFPGFRGPEPFKSQRRKRWQCGIPRDGKTWPKGMSWDRLRPGSGFRPPWIPVRQCEEDPECKANSKKNPPLVKLPDFPGQPKN